MRRDEIPMRMRILNCLARGRKDEWISGEALSRDFCISRAAVSKHVNTLRGEGNIIEAVPSRGYRLISRADPWAADDARNNLSTRVFGKKEWLWLKETGSTNQVAAEQAFLGAEEGLVVVARRQNEGRGSRGSRWMSLPGSLAFSVLIMPKLPPEKLNILPIFAMNACARAIEKSCGVSLEKRAPNDLFLHKRKVAGILVESMFHNTDLMWAVVGIGVNVNVPFSAIPPELEGLASSLYAETKTPFSVIHILRCILEELEQELMVHEMLRNMPKEDIAHS